jgi:hypothetical protein
MKGNELKMKTENAITQEDSIRDADFNKPDFSGIVFVQKEEKIIIRNVVCKSKEVYNYLHKAESIPIAFQNALETGVSVLSRASTGIDYDFVAKRANEVFSNLLSTITSYFDTNLDPMQNNSMARKITEIFNIQNGQIKELLSKENVCTAELERKMNTFSQSLSTSIQTAMHASASMIFDMAVYELLSGRKIKTSSITLPRI